MKKIACVFLVVTLVLAMLPGAISSQEKDDSLFIEGSDRIAIDGTNMLWDVQHVFSKLYPGLSGDALAQALNPYLIDSSPDNVGDTEKFWIQWGPDADHVDLWKQVDATCRAVGDYCYVYVEDAEWGAHITQTEVDEIVDTYDNIIYPVESENFRELPEYKGQTKTTIFLSDIEDGWGTGDPPQNIYIAGYFHSLNYMDDPHSNDRHLINIDTYPGIYHGGVADASHALGVVAHEYQHLLHFWSDPDETTWLNEGQSDYAEFLTLGILEDSHLAYFYAFHSPNLEQWGSGDAEILENYGASLSFMMYLYENFGGAALMSAIHNDTLNGRSSIDAQLPGASFNAVYTDWTLANLLDNPTLVGPNSGAALGYTSYDIGSADTWGYTMTNYLWNAAGFWLNWDWGPYPYSDSLYGLEDTYPSPDAGFWVDTQQQLDANYFIYEAPESPAVFNFNFLGNFGDDAIYQIAQPSVGELEWYSNSGNGWYDGNENTLSQTFDFSAVPCGPLTMEIDTWVDIEEGWDFGYVEVSTDGGTTWTQLQDQDGVMNNTRDPDAYVGVPGAYAFSAEAQAWYYDVTFDLSAYTGSSDVTVRFNYTTDDAYAPFGWIVDNIRLFNGGQLLDGSDLSDATWTPVGWTYTATIYPLEWTVYCVGIPYGGSPGQNDIYEVSLDAVTGDGFLQMPSFGSHYEKVVVVPSMISGEGIGGNFLYAHNGDFQYAPPAAAPVASTFTIFTNAQNAVVEELDKALNVFKTAQNKGYDVSELEPLFDSVNEDVSRANSGVNWIFRAGQLLNAIDTLKQITGRLAEIMA